MRLVCLDRGFIRVALVALTLSCWVTPAAWAINDSETVGFNANHHYLQGFMGENLDVLNGGLTLEIPIGPEYRTSTSFSYRLVLRYNSRIWSYKGDEGVTMPIGVLEGGSQFGVGFTMHFGKIYYEDHDPEPILHFESGDGAKHPMAHYGNDVYVTTDSSYIYARKNGSDWDAWLPDGTHLIMTNGITTRIEGPRKDHTVTPPPGEPQPAAS
jgi:hypothetical protein